MTFNKKSLLPTTFLGIIALVILSIGVYHYVFSNTTQHHVLSGTLGRIQEKIPDHQSLVRFATKESFDEHVFSTTTTSKFTIHPSLLNPQWKEENNLLSGNITLDTQRLHKDTHTGATNLHISVSGAISGIIDNKEDVYISFVGEISGRKTTDSMYVKLDAIDIKQNKRELTTLLLRDIVLHRFKDTWIELPQNTFPGVSLIDPGYIQTFLNNEITKIRLLTTPENDGQIYALSGQSLNLSGNRINEVNNTMDITLPQRSTTITIDSTSTPGKDTISAVQNNAYSGSFSGMSTMLYTKKLSQHRISGELIYPGGIRAQITHDRFLRKASGLTIKKAPEKFIQRDEVSKIRKDEKKLDVTLN